MTDLFPPNSMVRRVNAEPVLMLGAGRALLLQVAHPAVAQAVADHDDFPDKMMRRLRGTFDAMYGIVFGSEATAHAIGNRVRSVHEHVVGATYRANDPENLAWVHATLCDSALTAYARFGGVLTVEESEQYYDEMKTVAALFGVPADALPPSRRAFDEYVDAMVRTLPVTDVGRRLAAQIVAPPFTLPIALPLAPATALHRLVTIGTTPEPLRARFGFTWSSAEQRLLDAAAAASRVAFAATPRSLRVAPVGMLGQLALQRTTRITAPSEGPAADAR
jgi:uncharacterized protein (DUF2236 family)